VVVITSGVPRKPGMSRDDLLNVNYGIMQSVTAQIVKHSPNTIIVPVANPLDAMCQAVYRLSKFPRERVIGMAGILDSARMRAFIAMETGVSVENIHAFVLGGHGDTMVPLVSYTTVSGIPVTQLLAQDKLDPIVDRARNGGAEIVAHLKTGSAYYAPSAAAVQMVEAIVLDRKRLLPCSAWLEGEFGLNDVYCGVPCLLGRNGIERIVEITLTDAERTALHASAEAVRSIQAIV
jgi:malate dehydrogenase